MNTPRALIGIMPESNLKMQQKPLIGIEISRYINFKNSQLVVSQLCLYVKTKTWLGQLAIWPKKDSYDEFATFSPCITTYLNTKLQFCQVNFIHNQFLQEPHNRRAFNIKWFSAFYKYTLSTRSVFGLLSLKC